MEVQQDSSGRYMDASRYSVFRQAKVTAMYPTSNSADVVFFDGTVAKQLPIVGGLGSSVFGLSYTVQPEPTLDKPVPPQEIFPEGYPQNSNPPCTIDIYAVVSSFYGPRVSTGGYFIVGFMMPQYTEMKFPSQLENPDAFDKLLVYRHASDDQITIDKNGTFSLQHPSGARISMGDINAIDGSDIRVEGVDLTHKDVNEWYHFCSNKALPTAIHFEDSGKAFATFDGAGNIIIQDKYGNKITLDQHGITITDVNQDTITVDDGDIQLTVGNSQVDVGQDTISLTNIAGIIDQTSLVNTSTALTISTITGLVSVDITSLAVINITAPTINMNGNVNFNGTVDYL